LSPCWKLTCERRGTLHRWKLFSKRLQVTKSMSLKQWSLQSTFLLFSSWQPMWLSLQVALLFVNCLVLHLRLRLSCKKGYAPDDNPTRTCLDNSGDAQGVWSNQRPTCKRKWNVSGKNCSEMIAATNTMRFCRGPSRTKFVAASLFQDKRNRTRNHNKSWRLKMLMHNIYILYWVKFMVHITRVLAQHKNTQMISHSALRSRC